MASRSTYNTKAKKEIMSFLAKYENTSHSVKEIEAYLKKNNVNVNITTIYRKLQSLEKEKLIMKRISNDGKNVLYQHAGDNEKCSSHLHIQCLKCGNTMHLDCDDMKKNMEHIKDKYNIKVDCEKSILYGVCENCSKNNKR